MILSDKTIKDHIAEGKIQIFPNLNPSDIRLHLGADLLIPLEGQIADLDSDDELKFDKVSLLSDSFILHPGQFILGSTLEKFQVARDIVCHVDGRTAVARIALEMKNQGPFDIVLRYKTALAMLSFNQLSSEIEQRTQKQYQGQEGTTPPNLKSPKK